MSLSWGQLDLERLPHCECNHPAACCPEQLIYERDRLGHGIFSSDGEAWERSRTLLRPQFTRGQVSDLQLEERHLQNLLQALATNSNHDNWTQVTDLLPLFFRLTMDSASEFLFGESVNTQLTALPGSGAVQSAEDAAMVAAFEKSQDCIAYAFRFNDWYPLALTKEYYEACKVCHAYIDRFVQKALKQDIKTGGGAVEREKYIFLEALATQTQDPILIRDQLLSILVAGRDTTASLLCFLFLLLAQHPQVFDKLRSAVVAHFGAYKPSPNWNKITFSNLKGCTYLQHCLSETLRLYPTVPLNSRRSIVDTTLPRGGGPDGQSPLFVPKGTEVNYSVYVMHRNTAIWGPDAEKFIPERWEGRKAGWDFLPFNGGPRYVIAFPLLYLFSIPLLLAFLVAVSWPRLINSRQDLPRSAIRPHRSRVYCGAAAAALRQARWRVDVRPRE
jgi:cytochrome P450